MNKLSLGLISLTALCGTLALPAFAATTTTTTTPPPHLEGIGHGPGGAIDTNSDGKISLEEFLAPRVANLDKLIARFDKNSDGVLTLAEVTPPANPNAQQHAQRPARPTPSAAVAACLAKYAPAAEEQSEHESLADNFAAADSNSDGKLTLSELTAFVTKQAKAEFSELDQNGDGYLTQADFDALKAARQANAKALRDCLKAAR